MRCRFPIFLLALVLASHTVIADDSAKPSERKVLRRALPVYPELARTMNISGTVRLVVTVSPNGSVKSIRALGGNPVLIKAAEDTVTNWKYASGPEETNELVELHFAPR